MTEISDPGVQSILGAPNHAIVSTFNADGTIHSAVVWQEVVDGKLSVNTAVGRHWPTNLERDARITVLVYTQENPYQYVEIRGSARGTIDGADEQIDRLAMKFMGVNKYPMRVDGEQRISYVVDASRVRLQG